MGETFSDLANAPPQAVSSGRSSLKPITEVPSHSRPSTKARVHRETSAV